MTDAERAAALADIPAWGRDAALAIMNRLAEQSAPSPAPADLREVVARELCKAYGVNPDALFAPPQTMSSPRDPIPAWRERLGQADAAISAIQRDNVILPREPTEAMIEAACLALHGKAFETTARLQPSWCEAERMRMLCAIRAALAAKE